MTAASSTLYKGELYDEKFLEYPTSIKLGPVTFDFEVKYSNGVIKKDTVIINIIDNVFNAIFSTERINI
jgi:hypothetical protein